MFNKKIHEKIIFILIFLFSLTPLVWKMKDFIITGGDIHHPPVIENRFYLFFYSWSDYVNLGEDHSHLFSYLFFQLPTLIGSKILNFDPAQAQTFNYWFWNFILLLSFNYLLSKINKDLIFRYFSLLIFSFNYYFFWAWKSFQGNITSLILFLFILAITLDVFNKNYLKKKHLLKIFICFLFFSQTSYHPPILYVFLFFIFLLCATYFYQDYKLNKKTNFFYLQVFSIIILLLFFSSYWFLNLINYVINFYTETDTSPSQTFATSDLLSWYSSKIFLLSSLLNMSDIAYFDGSSNGLYYLKIYKKFFGGLKDFFPMLIYAIIIIFSFICALRSKNLNIRIFTLFFFISLILSSALRAPFGFIYHFLINYFPFFYVIRSPWMKWGFMLTISSSILIGFYFNELFKKLNKNYKFFSFRIKANNLKISIFLIFSFLYLNHTKYFIFGDHFFKPNDNENGFHYNNSFSSYVKIPDYIFQSTNFINSDKDFSRILSLPIHNSQNYDWGYGSLGDITFDLFLNKGVISSASEHGMNTNTSHNLNQKILNIRKNILFYSPGTFKKDEQISFMFNELNIKYILMRNDYIFLKEDENILLDSSLYSNFLKSYKFIKKIKTFGKWDIYINTNFQDTFAVCKDDNETVIPIYYKKINPDKIILPDIKNTCKQLTLNSNNNKNWVLIEDSNSFLKNFIQATKSFLSQKNEYFVKLKLSNTDILSVNRWSVINDKKDFTGKQFIVIFYQQYLKYFGFFIVFLSLVIILSLNSKFIEKIKK